MSKISSNADEVQVPKNSAFQKGRSKSPDSNSNRIKVFVRIRPLGPYDATDQFGAVHVTDGEMTQIKVTEGKTQKSFEFDQVIPQETANEEVYKIIGKPLVEACLTGLNAILMAYGQTGAGKTYTLMASDGITPNIVNTIFSIVERDQLHSYTVTCSYLQIYQERIYDLLCAGKMREVFLREHPKKGVFVERLSELLVKSPKDVSAFFSTGRKRLAFAETKMNRHSSRSHAICQLKVERINMPTRYGVFDAFASSMTSDSSIGDLTFQGLSSSSFEGGSEGSMCGSMDVQAFFDYEEDDDIFAKVSSLTNGASTVRGRLYICDLAGSERIKKTKAQGERLQEAQSINSSLLELGNVIHALAEGKNSFIPYRNSILTRFLQDGLSGNSRTSLIVCVSPSFTDVNETLCSLKFGLRAMKIENTASVNIEVDYEKMARQLAETLESKEREWRRLKSDYESYIMSLKANQKDNDAELDVRHYDQGLPDKPRNGPWQKTITDPVEESLKNQTKALLLVELISMELFYGMEDLLRDGNGSAGLNKEVTTDKLYTLTDRELLLHSAETLLELTEYFFAKSIPCPVSSTMTIVNEPCLDSNTDVGAVAQNGPPDSSYAGKFLRVRSTLCRIKESTDKAAVQFLSRLLDKQTTDSVVLDNKRKLHEALKEYVQRRINPIREEPEISTVLNLEQSLCHVLMDKALVNCILLLDKAAMEKKLKQLREEQMRFDLSGADSSLVSFRKKSSEDGSTRSDGRLISVDEGVVLEGSESTNSREKLSHPLESSSLAEMEAENRALCEKNAEMRKRLNDSEKQNESLSRKLSEVEKKLENSEQNSSEFARNSQLLEKLKHAEQHNMKLVSKVHELEAKLIQSSNLVRSSENSSLLNRIKNLEEKLKDKELEEENDEVVVNQVAVGLEDAVSDSLTLRARLCELEEQLMSRSNDDLSGIREKEVVNENTRLKEELKELEEKVNYGNEAKELLEKERKIQEDLIEEFSEQLKTERERCRDLSDKVSLLENCLKKSEAARIEELNEARNEIKELKIKLQTAEHKNYRFLTKAVEFEAKLKEVGKLVVRHKENERFLQTNIAKLEAENSLLRKEEITPDKRKNEEATGQNAEESTAAEDEPQKLRETIVQLETEIYLKDQEILCLKNEAVDLMSEVSKLDTEYNDLTAQKVKLEKEMKGQRKQRDDVEGELQGVLKECSKLRCDVLALMDENTALRNKIESTSDVLKTSVSAVLSERNLLERDLQAVQEREKELEKLTSDFENKNKTLQNDIEQREVTVKKLQQDLDELLSEKSRLHFSLSEMKDAKVNAVEENEALQQDIKNLERNLSTLQESLTYCLNEKVALTEEISIKASELNTLRTYSSLCSEEIRSMKSQIELYKETEGILNGRVDELKVSLDEWKKESLKMKEELGSIEDERKCLDQRIHEASRAIDRVKEELISLMHIVLSLQKELLCLVDGILACLDIEGNQLDSSRQRLVSSDSGYTSTVTEASSERSSAGSESNYAESLSTCILVPDEQCLVNPSEISIIRENKTEIFRFQEELKIKLLIIKDFLQQYKDNEALESAKTSIVEPTSEISHESIGDKLSEFPYLNKSEREKLTKLLTVLRRGNDNEGATYDLYSRLEEKLSALSSHLATKELQICTLLKEKLELQNELMRSKHGITLCEHCLSDPEKVNQSNELLRANLFSYMEDTARLESEIMEFAQYKAKLEEELNDVREQITEMEDQIIEGRERDAENVSRMEVKQSPSVRASTESSNESTTGSDTTEASERKSKPEKRVTFDKMVVEPKQTSCLRKRKHRDARSTEPSQDTRLQKPRTRRETIDEQETASLDEVDLCALLESIPIEPITEDKTKVEDKQVVEIVNRLSSYENMSFDDKVKFVIERQNSEDGPEKPDGTPGGTSLVVRYNDEGSNCKMCGLMKKKRSKESTKNTERKSGKLKYSSHSL